MKKILTLDDLVKVCLEQKLVKFNSREAGYKLRVRVPAKFEIDEEESTSTLFAHVQVMHTGRNRNGSNLTEKAAKECLKTMAYKPLLANFCEIDGVRDFTSHDFTINEDGEIEYQERQIGCLTADKPYMEDDPEVKGRKNIFAKVAIPREYTDAAEIIERKNGTKVSAELEINSMSYDSKEKELLLEDVELIGLTCLGTNPETGDPVEEGMENSHIQLEDFSADKNSLNFTLSEEIKKFIQSSIEEALDKNLSGKEDEKPMEFEEKTEVTETVTEEFDETEVTETEEVFESSEENESEEAEDTAVTEVLSEDTEVTPSEEQFDAEAEEADKVEESTDESSEDSTEQTEDEVGGTDLETNCLKMSVNVNGEIKTFEVSLQEKANAIYQLINSTYGETDNDFYDCDIYEESKTVVMHGFFSGKHFRQSYGVKKDVYSLKGDRIPVFAQYLTTDEIAQLDSMKSNYSSIESELAQYKAEPEKIAVLESEDYKNLVGVESFEALKEQAAHFEMSIDELKAQCDAMLLEFAKGHKVEAVEVKEVEEKKAPVTFKKIIPTSPSKTGKYGGIFSRNRE